jgi:hypothetical protein
LTIGYNTDVLNFFKYTYMFTSSKIHQSAKRASGSMGPPSQYRPGRGLKSPKFNSYPWKLPWHAFATCLSASSTYPLSAFLEFRARDWTLFQWSPKASPGWCPPMLLISTHISKPTNSGWMTLGEQVRPGGLLMIVFL